MPTVIDVEYPTRWIWKCGYLDCQDIVISYSHLRHDMNSCDCGKSHVDLEEEYCRTIGPVQVLSIKKNVNGEWVKVEAEES